MWDTIVIGLGISGLTAGAALARCGQRVLVLEQHSVAGGLTQTFQRHDWTFATGVHYVSGVGPDPGPDGQVGRMLHWLTDSALQFGPCGNPYDIVRLPGFEFGIAHPQAALRAALAARFPAQQAAITAWFEQLDAANQAARSLLVMRGLPAWLSWAWRLWRGAELGRIAAQTLGQAMSAIDVRTPVPGLLLAGHDVSGPGIQAACMSGLLAAAAFEPSLWKRLGG